MGAAFVVDPEPLPMRHAVPSLLLTLGLAGLAGPATAQNADELAALGARAREARDPRAALVHFRAALAADSMHYLANWQAALSLIDIAQEVPDDVRSPARDSMYALAEVYARRAVAASPGDADGHFTLANAVGRVALTRGKKERIRLAGFIRAEALRAIELRPTHDGAYHVLGRWHAEIMRLSGIQKFLAKSFLGAKIFNEASWDGATANLEKAVELNPERIFHRLDLATVYIDRDRYADARAQLEEIGRLAPLDYGDEDHRRTAVALLQTLAEREDD
jgi:tetratricopeptide (TPR) repeat protein